MNYASLAFTDSIKALQEEYGSRKSYDRMEKFNVIDGLSENEIDFIEQRDSMYIATIGENGYPYIQHRGGPRGFVKVLDNTMLGMIDFAGNKQYISLGNMQDCSRVSIIMVSYPQKARLKLYADVRIIQPSDDPELFRRLDPSDYKHRAERIMVFDIKAFDWNCPQHITPRYTIEEIEHAFAPQRDYSRKLEEELHQVKLQLQELTP